MKRKNTILFLVFAVVLFLTWTFLNSTVYKGDFAEKMKVSLRSVGNELLLANKDSTSLVLPITVEKANYTLSFQNKLAIEPGNLVELIDATFQKRKQPTDYLVEVIQCDDLEVAYSYEIKNKQENDLMPCSGRVLPKKCYFIVVKFANIKSNNNYNALVYGIVIGIFMLLFIGINRKKPISKIEEESAENYTSIGSFRFFPQQNILIKEEEEISLSKKECELLELFIASPNKTIKREELTKKVWEDKGVIVGRSLDTYISKLRKKLKADDTIKIANVHGIGYKLEINT